MAPPRKRHRKRTKQEDRVSSSLSGRNSSWVNLPRIPLQEIFSYLSPTDRFHASMACRNWADASRTSYVWRHATFKFVNAKSSAYMYAIKRVLQRHGSCMRNLSFTFKRAKYDEERLQHKVCYFMELLRDNNVQLRSVRMPKVSTKVEDPESCLILESVQDFVASQTDLRMVDFSNARLGCAVGVNLLNSLVKCNVRELNIINFFGPTYELLVHEFEGFRQTLCTFTNLRRLSLDYGCLSDENLEFIGSALGERLQVLEVSCNLRSSYAVRPIISDKAWKSLTQKCPSIIVDYNIAICHDLDPRWFLSKEVPLRNFEFSASHRYHGNFLPIFEHLQDHFSDTLESVTLHIRVFSQENFGTATVMLSSICERLKRIVITTDYIINDYEEFMKAAATSDFPALEFVKFRFKHFWNNQERFDYIKKRKKYMPLLKDKRTKFSI